MILQTTNYVNMADQIALLLPAIEGTLVDLQPLPRSPGNLTAFAGTYLASVLGGYDIACCHHSVVRHVRSLT